MPDQQNSAACSLRYLSQPHEDRTDFVRPVHVHVGTEIRLDRVDDDQSGVVLNNGFFNSFIRKGELHLAVVNDQHPVKVCARFDQAGLDRIAQTVLSGLVDHVEGFHALHVGQQLSVGAGGGKVHGKVGLALTRIALQNTELSKRQIPLILPQRIGLQRELSAWSGIAAEHLNTIATFDILFNNPSLLIKNGLGYAFALRTLVDTSESPTLCFRPLEPAIKIQYGLAWKRYPIFSKAAEKFIEQLRELVE